MGREAERGRKRCKRTTRRRRGRIKRRISRRGNTIKNRMMRKPEGRLRVGRRNKTRWMRGRGSRVCEMSIRRKIGRM
jgi:hypothetical protein